MSFETHVIRSNTNARHTFRLNDYIEKCISICLCVCVTNQGIDQIERNQENINIKWKQNGECVRCAHTLVQAQKGNTPIMIDSTVCKRTHYMDCNQCSDIHILCTSYRRVHTLYEKSVATSLVFRCGLFDFAFSLCLLSRLLLDRSLICSLS